MDLAVIFSTAFLVGLTGAMMPGPLMTVTISETARRGFIAGPLLMLGHAILELALVVALVEGLSAYLTKISVSHTIAVLGGSFLIYMGYGIIKDALAGKVSISLSKNSNCGTSSGAQEANSENLINTNSQVAGKTDRKYVPQIHPVLAGALISLSNPYWSLWWATIGIGYITLSLKNGLPGLASFFSGHIMADLIWYCLIAAAIAGGRKFLKNSIYRGILIICGLFLVGLGCYFIYFGIFNGR